jgi:hypothetical protein
VHALRVQRIATKELESVSESAAVQKEDLVPKLVSESATVEGEDLVPESVPESATMEEKEEDREVGSHRSSKTP